MEELHALAKHGQHFHFDHAGQQIVYSDKKLFRNVLINIVSNAIKFSPENSEIRIDCNVSDKNASVDVTDKGIGISKDDQEHLFSSFFRAKNALNIAGTGLGLHIVKRYIALLGGNVHLKSELNEGTTISFTIPITKNEIDSGY